MATAVSGSGQRVWRPGCSLREARAGEARQLGQAASRSKTPDFESGSGSRWHGQQQARLLSNIWAAAVLLHGITAIEKRGRMCWRHPRGCA